MKSFLIWDKYDNKYREVVDVEVARGLEADLYEANNRINDLLDVVKQKDELIDEMAEQLAGIAIWDNKKDEPLILMSKEEVIEYFEKRCNNAKD